MATKYADSLEFRTMVQRAHDLTLKKDLSPQDVAELAALTEWLKIAKNRVIREKQNAVTDDFFKSLDIGIPGGAPDRPALSGGSEPTAWAQAKSMGYKALVAGGSTGLGAAFDGAPKENPRQARFITDLIPTETLTGTDAFKYLRQSARTNNAAKVAAGATKPTSVYTVTDKSDTLDVFAHLSEFVPRYLLEDNASLGQFLEAEMRLGIETAIESDFVAQLIADADIATVSVPGGDDVRTIRRAIRLLQNDHVDMSRVILVIGTQDAEELDLDEFTSVGGTGSSGYKFQGPNTGPNEAWNIPIVVSTALAAGQGLIGDFSQGLRMYSDNNLRIDVDEATNFAKNEVRVRVEIRAALAVLRTPVLREIAFIIGS